MEEGMQQATPEHGQQTQAPADRPCGLTDAYRHTVPAPDLIDRLRKIEQGDGYGDHVTQWYRNPDGLEAANEILRLRDIIKTYAAICKATDEIPNPR